MLEKDNVYNLRNRSVKRMLWPVDHDQIRRDLKKEQQKTRKELTEKYNFDFESEKPLHGKYDWVPVSSESPISSPCLIEEENVPCCSIASTRINNKTTNKSRKRLPESHKVSSGTRKKKKTTKSSVNVESSIQKGKRKSGKFLCSIYGSQSVSSVH